MPDNNRKQTSANRRSTAEFVLHDVTVDAHGLTDVGRTRENNEDQFLIGTLRKSIAVTETSLSTRQREQLDESTQTLLLLVADGVAGQRGGERASAVALESVVAIPRWSGHEAAADRTAM